MIKFVNIKLSEKDNLLGAFSKGMIEGAINGGLLGVLIGGGLYVASKAIPEIKVVETEEELEAE